MPTNRQANCRSCSSASCRTRSTTISAARRCVRRGRRCFLRSAGATRPTTISIRWRRSRPSRTRARPPIRPTGRSRRRRWRSSRRPSPGCRRVNAKPFCCVTGKNSTWRRRRPRWAAPKAASRRTVRAPSTRCPQCSLPKEYDHERQRRTIRTQDHCTARPGHRGDSRWRRLPFAAGACPRARRTSACRRAGLRACAGRRRGDARRRRQRPAAVGAVADLARHRARRRGRLRLAAVAVVSPVADLRRARRADPVVGPADRRLPRPGIRRLAQDVCQRLILALCVALALAAARPALAQLPLSSPKWSELSAQERATLAPLAPPEWDKLDAQRKHKWRGLAERYPRMTPERQARMRDQMQAWSRLTPDERHTARERYQALRKLPADQRAEVRRKWDEYNKLPPAERAAMRARSAGAPAGPRPLAVPHTGPFLPPVPGTTGLPGAPRAAPGPSGATMSGAPSAAPHPAPAAR